MNDKVVIVGGVEEYGKYVFSFCGIAPQCMGDTVKAELLLNGEVISIKESYSVKAYVEGAIELYSGDEKLMRLLADLLYYGEAAQEYLGYKTDALVTAGVTDLPEASDVAPTNEDNNKSIAPNKDEGTRFIAAGVRFDYDNKIYVKLMVVGEDNVTVTVNSETLELISLGAGVYVAYSDGISALHFDEKIVFTLSVNGEESQTLTYTVNDYAYSKRSDAEIGELSLALYRYGKSAQDYNGSN